MVVDPVERYFGEVHGFDVISDYLQNEVILRDGIEEALEGTVLGTCFFGPQITPAFWIPEDGKRAEGSIVEWPKVSPIYTRIEAKSLRFHPFGRRLMDEKKAEHPYHWMSGKPFFGYGKRQGKAGKRVDDLVTTKLRDLFPKGKVQVNTTGPEIRRSNRVLYSFVSSNFEIHLAWNRLGTKLLTYVHFGSQENDGHDVFVKEINGDSIEEIPDAYGLQDMYRHARRVFKRDSHLSFITRSDLVQVVNEDRERQRGMNPFLRENLYNRS
jgi:hypothetical protein